MQNTIRLCAILGFLVSPLVIISQILESQPRPIQLPDFVLTNEAETVGIDGNIVLALTIEKDGNVASAEVAAGPSWPCGIRMPDQVLAVRKSAIAWAKTLKFSPGIKNGKPAKTGGSIILTVGQAARDAKTQEELDEAVKAGRIPPRLAILAGRIDEKAVFLAKPTYPPAARPINLAGPVRIETIVDSSGTVVAANEGDGHPLFRLAARMAACSSKFAPSLFHGRAVRVYGTMNYYFRP